MSRENECRSTKGSEIVKLRGRYFSKILFGNNYISKRFMDLNSDTFWHGFWDTPYINRFSIYKYQLNLGKTWQARSSFTWYSSEYCMISTYLGCFFRWSQLLSRITRPTWCPNNISSWSDIFEPWSASVLHWTMPQLPVKWTLNTSKVSALQQESERFNWAALIVMSKSKKWMTIFPTD